MLPNQGLVDLADNGKYCWLLEENETLIAQHILRKINDPLSLQRMGDIGKYSIYARFTKEATINTHEELLLHDISVIGVH